MFDKIKGCGHISQAAEHITTVSEEVTHSFNNSPCAHVGRDTRLLGELEVIDAEAITKKKKDDPIK